MRGLLTCGRIAVVAAAMTATSACSSDPADRSLALQATSYEQLPGGPRALAEPGDYVLENSQVRVVVQGPGFSRGFGMYGGSLIDAVPRNVADDGNIGDRAGVDAFAELFPAFFLQAVAVDNVAIVNDGTNGEPAVVEASGTAADFLELAGLLNRLGTNSHVDPADPSSEQRFSYRIRYELPPAARHVVIRFSVRNETDEAVLLPSPDAVPLLSVLAGTNEPLTIPIGDVALFGAATDVFIPGAGFDVRFGVEDAYNNDVQFPSFPGLIADFVAARADGVSYLLATEPSENNYLWQRREAYGADAARITTSSMLIPFVASGFLGIFYAAAPPELGPGEEVEVTKYFVIGHGDVASALDELYRIRGEAVGRVGGRVLDAISGAGADDTWVVVEREGDDGVFRAYSEFGVDSEGRFQGTLAPGNYNARVAGRGRPIGQRVPFAVEAGRPTHLQLGVAAPAHLSVRVVNADGTPTPAKVTVVGTAPLDRANENVRDWLFDLQAGEELLSTDLLPDTEDPDTRRYIETVHVSVDGVADLRVRPGAYTVYASRGPEFQLASSEVILEPGATSTRTLVLERAVPTPGWISFDPHVHSIQSIDSSISLDTRIASLAAEGVEVFAMTDHNNVTNPQPWIDRLDAIPWVRGITGIELTTLESGHFNAYPLEYQIAPRTHGAFQWSQRPPDDIFAELRSLGPDNIETVVQVNHPRDSIIGYFDQYDRDGITTELVPPSSTDRLIEAVTNGGSLSPTGPAFVDADGNTTFSLAFDAFEVLNGKLLWQIHHHRMPTDWVDDLAAEVRLPPPGTILFDDDNEVAFPGAMDDWFNLLNLGERPIGIGSSDSHGLADEVGYFRTFVRVAIDAPAQLDEAGFFEALRSHRAFATNGPMLDVRANGSTDTSIGDELVDTDGVVDLAIDVSVADWVPLDRVNIIHNGRIAATWPVSRDELVDGRLQIETQVTLRNGEGALQDGWIVVQVLGSGSLFPVVRPLDVPPLNLTNAIGALAGPLGFGSDEFGRLIPAAVFPIGSIAITNPIWIRTSADTPWTPPGIVPRNERAAPEQNPGFDLNPLDDMVYDPEAERPVEKALAPAPDDGHGHEGHAHDDEAHTGPSRDTTPDRHEPLPQRHLLAGAWWHTMPLLGPNDIRRVLRASACAE